MSFILDTSEPDVMSAKYATQMMMPIIMSSPSMATVKQAKAIPYFGGNVNADSVTDHFGCNQYDDQVVKR